MRQGRKSEAQTKAPIKDRIKGSNINKKGSASSTAKASAILLSDEIISALSKKAEDFNKKNKGEKVSVNTLKAVFRRGAGAFSTSHRPNMTRNGWAYARVNKFLEKKGGKEVKKAYIQDDDLMEKGGSVGQEITCHNCYWQWNTKDSDDSDKYVCHKCGFDNTLFYSNDIRYEKGGKMKNIVEQIGELVAPFQKELAEQRIARLIEEGEKLSKWAKELIYLGLVYDLYSAIGNYLYDTDKLVGKIKFEEGSGGSIEISAILERDGQEYKFRTEMIIAGGYNIQRRHYRYIVHTGLKYHQGNAEAESVQKEIKELKEKIKFQNKIEEYQKDIEFYKNTIEKYKVEIANNKKFTDEQIWEMLKEQKDYRAESYNLTWEEMVRRQAPVVEMTKSKEGYEAYKYENYYLDGIKSWKESNIEDLERRIRSYTAEIKKIEKRIQKAQGLEQGGELEDLHQKMKDELLQDSFKSHKSIEQIAEDKGVELDYAQEQLRKGMQTESEHSDDPMVQEIIALQHLDEMIDYYEKLEFIEANTMEKGGVIEFNKNFETRLNELKKDYQYDGSENDLSKINSNVAVAFLQHLADSIGEKYYQWDWANESKNPTNYFQIDMYLESGNTLRGLFVYVDDNHKVIKSKSNVKLFDNDYNEIKVLVEEPKIKSSVSEYNFDYKGYSFEILRLGSKWKFFGKYIKNFQSVPEMEDTTKAKLISRIEKFTDIILDKDDDDFEKGGEIIEYKIDGKDATFEDFIELFKSVSGEFRQFDLNSKRVEYFGNEEQAIRALKDYNYIISPFMKDGSLKDNYMKANILEIYKKFPFRTFANSFRKHIDPSFKAINKELKSGRTFNEIASYVIGDGGYYIDEDKYKGFAKDFDIEIPQKNTFEKGGLVYNKIYNKGGGGYTTNINGKIYNIEKQYSRGTWVAQSDDGEYYQETRTLEDLKSYLENLNKETTKKMEKGGDIDPDNKQIKDMITHKSGNAGGILVGNRHSEGGIKAVNKSTNTPLEMEGGEVVITRNAVSDDEKREFEGEMLTNREILSKINESGGGVSFEEGGKVDYNVDCGDEMAKGGDLKNFEPKSLVGKMLVGKIRYSEIVDVKDMGNGNIWVIHESFSGFTSEENFTKDELFEMLNGKEVRGEVIKSKKSSKMADGGSLDTHFELKEFFQEQNTPVIVQEPVVEEVFEEIVETPVEIMLYKEDLTMSDDSPMIYVGSSIYANNSNGTDEWVVKSFSNDGVNLLHIPNSPLSYKHENKHITFDELTNLFNNKSISIKFVLNERELNLILMILKDKLQKTTSFKDGGIVFVDKEGKDDEEIMESQFGNKQF